MMRLTYEIEKTTDIDAATIYKRIVAVLDKRKYRILHQQSNSIAFDRFGLRFRWSWEPAQLDGGEFKLDDSGGRLKVKLSYYISYTVIIIMVVGLMLTIAYTRDMGWVYMSIFLLMLTLLQYFNLRFKAKALINDALIDAA